MSEAADLLRQRAAEYEIGAASHVERHEMCACDGYPHKDECPLAGDNLDHRVCAIEMTTVAIVLREIVRALEAEREAA